MSCKYTLLKAITSMRYPKVELPFITYIYFNIVENTPFMFLHTHLTYGYYIFPPYLYGSYILEKRSSRSLTHVHIKIILCSCIPQNRELITFSVDADAAAAAAIPKRRRCFPILLFKNSNLFYLCNCHYTQRVRSVYIYV